MWIFGIVVISHAQTEGTYFSSYSFCTKECLRINIYISDNSHFNKDKKRPQWLCILFLNLFTYFCIIFLLVLPQRSGWKSSRIPTYSPRNYIVYLCVCVCVGDEDIYYTSTNMQFVIVTSVSDVICERNRIFTDGYAERKLR